MSTFESYINSNEKPVVFEAGDTVERVPLPNLFEKQKEATPELFVIDEVHQDARGGQVIFAHPRGTNEEPRRLVSTNLKKVTLH